MGMGIEKARREYRGSDFLSRKTSMYNAISFVFL